MRAWRFMATNYSRRQFYFLLALMLGVSLGFMLSVGPGLDFGAPSSGIEVSTKGGCAPRLLRSSQADFEPALLSDPNLRSGPLGPNDKVLELLRGTDQRRRLILVGVMTAQKYLDTRAVAVHNTWARSLPGHVIFFTGAHALAAPDLPVVRLPTVDDAYPPQKKSFLMLKFMSEQLVGRYEWFMRADDDVYVRGEALQAFLRSVNSSKAQFIGQAGTGNKEEFGQLNLEPEENFCMGGPGVVFSAETLRRVGPNVRHCLKNLYSTHEDVEVGRCVRLFAGISCTWSYEMQTIFYHNSSGQEAFTGSLKQREIHRAITLHPVKQHHHFYRLHNYFLSLKMKDILQTNLLLHRDIKLAMDRLQYPRPKTEEIPEKDGSKTEVEYAEENASVAAEAPLSYAAETRLFGERHSLPVLGNSWERGKAPSLLKTLPRNDSEVLKWEFIHRAVYSHAHSNPRRGVNGALSETLNDAVSQIMELINRFAKQRGRVIDFKDILYAYRRLDPAHGADFVLDLLLVYKKYRGRKMTLPVRKHVYAQRTFTDLQIRSAHHYPLTSENNNNLKMPHKRINFILPLAGRFRVFRRFLDNFERVCLAGTSRSFSVSLSVVLFPETDLDSTANNETASNVKYSLDNLRNKYGGEGEFELLRRFETFSRAAALELGSARFGEDQLLLFIDVDMQFDEHFARRVCAQTLFNQQVYFPIVFSQFDPKFTNREKNSEDSENLKIDENLGYWRVFGFGIVSLYKGDLRRVGGLDTSIRGWGQEDVDLYDKVIRSDLKVFRAPDPGLVHVFHSIECDPRLAPVQLTMCQGSKASSLASVTSLAKMVYEHPEIIARGSHVGQLMKDQEEEENSDRQR